MAETEIYLWTDPRGYAYVQLRFRAGHWQVEWGHRDPPGGDKYLERGKHETSVRDEAVRQMLEQIGAMSDVPDEAKRVEKELVEALAKVA